MALVWDCIIIKCIQVSTAPFVDKPFQQKNIIINDKRMMCVQM